MPYMQEDLREHKLLQIEDVLHAATEPLTVAQIQYRLGANRGVDMSREEIEAHLNWGAMQPNATNSPLRIVRAEAQRHDLRRHSTWTVTGKRPVSAEEEKLAGPPPWMHEV